MGLLLKKFQFARADDPRRCQNVEKNQQCKFIAVEGSEFCQRHGFNGKRNGDAKKAVQIYYKSQYAKIIEEQANHPKLKSLQEEVGILRMTLESYLQSCGGDENKILMYSGKITELAREVRETLNAAHKLDISLGLVLDQNQAKEWITDLVDILSLYIDDEAGIQMIAEHMLTSLEQRLNKC